MVQREELPRMDEGSVRSIELEQSQQRKDVGEDQI
jgi:hypothetical protein